MSENTMKSDDILTPEQLAERLQVGVSWVYEKSRSRGTHSSKPLPVLRCGRYLRFYWPDVCQWLRNGIKEKAHERTKKAEMNPTRYSFRYSGILALTAILLQVFEKSW